MSTLPKITIVTPSYNQGRYLEETIRSVLGQGYPNLEYIVMDGGSNDGSIDIIRRYEHHLAYWQSQPDSGQADAIDKGFAKANGEIIGWLNSDDFLMPGCLSIVARKFALDEGAVAVSGRCICVDASGEPTNVYIPGKRSWKGMLFLGQGLAQMATFWKRQAWHAVGALNTSLRFSFDYDLFIRLRRFGEIAIVPNYLAASRLHPLSKTSTMQDISRIEKRLVQQKYGLKGYVPTRVSYIIRRLHLYKRVQNILVWQRDKSKLKQICTQWAMQLSQSKFTLL